MAKKKKVSGTKKVNKEEKKLSSKDEMMMTDAEHNKMKKGMKTPKRKK